MATVIQHDIVLPLDAPETRDALARWLRDATHADTLNVTAMTRLSGGAIQENWAISADVQGGAYHGKQEWVLRTDSASSIAVSRSRAEEFALLQAVHAAGVCVPEPLWLCSDTHEIGRSFFIMQRVRGIAAGHRLTREAALLPDADALAHSLGRHLARVHSVQPGHALLSFLGAPRANPVLADIGDYRAHFDALSERYPVLEWGLRWCELNAPEPLAPVLLHRDFRTGNYMVDRGELSGILDWEFAGWGDRREDLGWFTARCWRFAGAHREAGGIADVEPFLAGYREESGIAFRGEDLRYWQVLAHLRWALIALQQTARHTSNEERSLELALTGQLVPDLELEIVRLLDGGFDD
ncbi:phosphotransferase family protein [Caballeronia sp. BR00000012568055]|uniref:phosphotransferase family protein n=1 Tax=Caballeronia sp. BR00000012568055 TaxID=2918761 RepID=UPI0023F66029|nr:phosphotransferase family protein [Caballeronia sp. BR00000012568055]